MGLELINVLRKEKGMSVEDLSIKSNVPLSTLSKITAGITQNPNYETVRAIARALGCSTDVFDDFPKKTKTITPFENNLVKKFRTLDEHGKKLVELILNAEYERISADDNETLFIAARGGGTETATLSKEQAEKARKTAQDLPEENLDF